jgi:4,5-dihydroxyphthalate decarboxylase
MPRPVLRTVTRSQGNNRALKEGRVGLPDFELAFEEVDPLVKGFRRMVRELAYDVAEMALTTYICAKAHGVAFTAIPVFLVRDFHHGAIQVNRHAGLRTGRDFEGRRVGVNRGYTVTTGVWARAILQEEHGLDLSRVTWVRSGEEHVAEFVPPKNVVDLEPGHDLAADLASGALPAAVGTAVEHPAVVPFVENPFAAGVAALKGRGLYPINHLVVVKDEVLAAHPGLAAQLFEAFAASKRLYVEELKAGGLAAPTRADKVALAALEVMDDPLPYGIEPNRKVLETLMGHAVTQGIVPSRMDIEGLFAEEVRGLVG